MPHEHRHSDSHRGHTRCSGGHASPSEHTSALRRHERASGSSAPAEGGGPAGSRAPRRADPSSCGSAGRGSSLLCLLAAGVGFAAVLAAAALSRATQSPAQPGLNLFAGACAMVSLAAGVRAQIRQMRHWSRRAKRRLLVGMPVALCTGLAVIVNARERLSSHGGRNEPSPAPASARASKPEDNSLIKPGWYGEILANGVLLVITSYEENAAESRRFNQGLFKPVAYATLTVINAGSGSPVKLASPQVTLLLENGERAASLAVAELLSHGGGAHEALLKRLAEQQEIPIGGMLPDIPVCLDEPFDWSRVKAVEVAIGPGTVAVPGHLMSVAEKQAVLFRSPAKRSAATTNVTAEAWFKDL